MTTSLTIASLGLLGGAGGSGVGSYVQIGDLEVQSGFEICGETKDNCLQSNSPEFELQVNLQREISADDD